MTPAEELLNHLVGEQLSAVVFVQDYLQLQFDEPQLNVYEQCRVIANGISTEFGTEPFANHILGQITKIVESVTDNNHSVIIRFEDQSLIEIPYSQVKCPEAIYFQGKNGQWGVWPG